MPRREARVTWARETHDRLPGRAERLGRGGSNGRLGCGRGRRAATRATRALIVLGGSTNELSANETTVLRSVGEVLARVAADERLTVVTGGTDAGIFAIFGQALAGQATAPCVGVAPAGAVTWPGRSERWVDREVGTLCASKSPDRLFIALTAGTLAWDDEHGDFDRARTGPIPHALTRVFDAEPLRVDFTSVRIDDVRELRLTTSPASAILAFVAPATRRRYDAAVRLGMQPFGAWPG